MTTIATATRICSEKWFIGKGLITARVVKI
jgi:hypothetical protein